MTQELAAVEHSNDFASGFDDKAETPIAAPVPAAEEPVAVPTESPAAGEAAQAVAPGSEAVTLTRAELTALQQRLENAERFHKNVDSRIDTLGGKFGEVNRALQNLPKGSALTPERFARIKAEYPELGPLLEEALLDASPGAAAMPQADIDKLVQEKLAEMSTPMRKQLMDEIKAEAVHEKMTDAHADYVEVLKSPEFDEWRQGLSFKRAQEIETSSDPKFVIKAISDFKARNQPALAVPAVPVAPAPSPQTSNVRARLEAAITPQGSPNRGAPSKTEQDYFKEGFTS